MVGLSQDLIKKANKNARGKRNSFSDSAYKTATQNVQRPSVGLKTQTPTRTAPAPTKAQAVPVQNTAVSQAPTRPDNASILAGAGTGLNQTQTMNNPDPALRNIEAGFVPRQNANVGISQEPDNTQIVNGGGSPQATIPSTQVTNINEVGFGLDPAIQEAGPQVGTGSPLDNGQGSVTYGLDTEAIANATRSNSALNAYKTLLAQGASLGEAEAYYKNINEGTLGQYLDNKTASRNVQGQREYLQGQANANIGLNQSLGDFISAKRNKRFAQEQILQRNQNNARSGQQGLSIGEDRRKEAKADARYEQGLVREDKKNQQRQDNFETKLSLDKQADDKQAASDSLVVMRPDGSAGNKNGTINLSETESEYFQQLNSGVDAKFLERIMKMPENAGRTRNEIIVEMARAGQKKIKAQFTSINQGLSPNPYKK